MTGFTLQITRRRSLQLVVGALLAFFLSGILLVKSQKAPAKQASREVSTGSDAQATAKRENSVVLSTFHRSETRGDKKLWEIEAARGELFPSDNTALIEEAVLYFYKEDNTTIRLEAPRAKLYLNGASFSRAELQGGVVMKYGDQMTMKTASATYDQTSGTVIAPGRTTIEGATYALEGNMLVADISGKTGTLAGAVKSVFRPRKTDA